MASFDLSARYTASVGFIDPFGRTHKETTLCFTHAVQAAVCNYQIEQEIDEFGQSGNDMRDTTCLICLYYPGLNLEDALTPQESESSR